MVNIIDCTVIEFEKNLQGKKVIAFGAGRKFVSFVERHNLQDKIKYVVDNDKTKVGTKISVGNSVFVIKSPELLNHFSASNTVILITSVFFCYQIIQELDQVDYLNHIECYVCALMQEKCAMSDIHYTTGKDKIPRKIHYFWFGGKEIPDRLKEYMKTWEKFCPDYEIIRWDESNYDVSKNTYMYQAYKKEKWGYVPDYARLDIIYQYGGIYLDTDVEMLKPLDDLLKDSSFMGFFDSDCVALGLGFGAVPKNMLIKKMMDYYNNVMFEREDGTIDMNTCVDHQYNVLKSYGFLMNNTQQIIDGNMLYPTEEFNPMGKIGYYKCFSENTHTVHHTQSSYEDEKTRKAYRETIDGIKERIEGTNRKNLK